jgi:hypothetical protein
VAHITTRTQYPLSLFLACPRYLLSYDAMLSRARRVDTDGHIEEAASSTQATQDTVRRPPTFPAATTAQKAKIER